MFDAIIGFLDGIWSFFEMLIELMTNGFEAITTFISLPTDSLSALWGLENYFPPYIWIPTISLISICIMLRIWSVITSGGGGG